MWNHFPYKPFPGVSLIRRSLSTFPATSIHTSMGRPSPRSIQGRPTSPLCAWRACGLTLSVAISRRLCPICRFPVIARLSMKTHLPCHMFFQ